MPQLDELSPSTPTLVPQTFTGAVTGTDAAEPDAPEPGADAPEPVAADEPSVDEPSVDDAEEPAGAHEEFALPTLLPQTVTGATIGAETVEPFASELADELAPEAAGAQEEFAAPSRPTLFPQTFTGAATGASTAEPVPSEPLAAVALVADPSVAGLVDAVPLPAETGAGSARPSTLTEFPVTDTGAVTGAAIVASAGDEATTEAAAGAAALVVPGPSRLMALPATVTGAVAGNEMAGGVAGVSADAMLVPSTHMPPVKTASCSPRLIQMFMVSSL